MATLFLYQLDPEVYKPFLFGRLEIEDAEYQKYILRIVITNQEDLPEDIFKEDWELAATIVKLPYVDLDTKLDPLTELVERQGFEKWQDFVVEMWNNTDCDDRVLAVSESLLFEYNRPLALQLFHEELKKSNSNGAKRVSAAKYLCRAGEIDWRDLAQYDNASRDILFWLANCVEVSKPGSDWIPPGGPSEEMAVYVMREAMHNPELMFARDYIEIAVEFLDKHGVRAKYQTEIDSFCSNLDPSTKLFKTLKNRAGICK